MAFGMVLVDVTVDDWCGDIVEDGSGDEDKDAVIIICVGQVHAVASVQCTVRVLLCIY